jgi:hypothetical protein
MAVFLILKSASLIVKICLSDIVIVPNPATNTILINGITTSTEVAIYGLTGELLSSKKIRCKSSPDRCK